MSRRLLHTLRVGRITMVVGAIVLRDFVLCDFVRADDTAAAAPDPAAHAKVLFESGREAMERKDYDTACAKFRESYRLAGAPGPLLNWADCEEARGRLGTALRLWRQAKAKVSEDPKRASFTTERIAALSSRTPTLRFVVQAAGVDPIVKIDGLEVDERTVVPIDPGPNAINVEAPGFEPEEYRVEGRMGDEQTLTILARPLAPSSGTPTAPRPTPKSDDGGSPLVPAGFVVAGVGLAGLVMFGVTAGLVVDTCGGFGDATCPKAHEDKVHVLNALNLTGAIVGVLGLGAGIPLLVSGLRHDGAPKTGAAAIVGPGWIGAEARF